MHDGTSAQDLLGQWKLWLMSVGRSKNTIALRLGVLRRFLDEHPDATKVTQRDVSDCSVVLQGFPRRVLPVDGGQRAHREVAGRADPADEGADSRSSSGAQGGDH